jgi:hypothetical protein
LKYLNILELVPDGALPSSTIREVSFTPRFSEVFAAELNPVNRFQRFPIRKPLKRLPVLMLTAVTSLKRGVNENLIGTACKQQDERRL